MNRRVAPKTIHAPEWSVAEAKARFSEVVARARSGEPQRVTRYGNDEVVVVSASHWDRMSGVDQAKPLQPDEPGSLLAMFEPLRGLGLSDALDEIENNRGRQPLDLNLLEP